MNKSLILKVLSVWLAFVPIAVINGSLRQLWYQKYTGDLAGHQISTLTGSLAFAALAYFMMRGQVAELSGAQLFAVGGIWLFLTLVFEFGMGLSAGRSWAYMLADYNLLKGRLWPLLLLVVVFTPHLLKWLAKK